MKKKDNKVRKQPIAEVQNTETRLSVLIKKLPLFIAVMGASFVITIGIVRLIPHLLVQVKRISLPKLSNQFTRKAERKIVFSGNENYTTIDPMLLKGYLDTKTKNVIIIDTRSKAEYANGYIKGALNIALYTDFRNPYESAVTLADWIGKVKKQSWGTKEIILYGYSADADIIRVAVETLRKRGVRAKILSIGYSEWQGGIWNWIAGGELNGTLNINDYIERK